MITGISVNAQHIKISGIVSNSADKENIAAVSVVVKETGVGTYTDQKGHFTIHVKSLPATLIFSSIGFVTLEKSVSVASDVMVDLVVSKALGQDIVIAASRVPERILESPVSIERIGAAQIRNSPASGFYDIVSNLKGIDFTTSSLTYRTMTTRGFGGSGNPRFNQLVDGMDNQAPGLNFSVSSIVGLSELDVDNMELLSGASSALYGSGGMNGTLLMTSKSPFKDQGLSVLVKQGIMHVDESERPASPFYNWNVRWALKVSERFAFKINAEFLQAKDWIGMDYRDYDRSNAVLRPGTRQSDPNYDGVNVFGDETSADLRQVLDGIAAQAPFLAPFISTLTSKPILVSRTGYTEQQLLDPVTSNLKFSGSAHYKITDNTEAILAGYWGTGNTLYTGASRYSIQDFIMGQYKFELKNKDWMFRAFTTQENAGGSYNLAATTQIFNEAWKPSGGSTGWYSQYGQSFLSSKLAGLSDYDAHNTARNLVDSGRPALGSSLFNSIYDSIRKLPVPQGGALLDRSDLYVVEGNYNFSKYTKKVADVIAGASWRQYSLNSQGSLFTDSAGPIGINEYGVYAQASRAITSNLKVTASGRYDKNQNFKGKFTPRVTAVYTVAPKSNIRLSYQTSYRFPSSQQQFIDIDLITYKLIGADQSFNSIYHFDVNPLYYRDSLQKGVIAKYDFNQLKPESISSFEAGYRGLLLDDKLLVDVYGYYGKFKDFISRRIVVQSKTEAPISLADTISGQIYSVPVNSEGKITTYGFGIGLDYQLPKNFTLGLNLSSDNLSDVAEDLIVYFNSPKYKFNGSISNSGFGKGDRYGFSINYRWQDKFFFEGDLANGTLPAVNILDAQISYKFPKVKSVIKFGANNLLNQYYYNAIGNSRVGGLYYVSFGYNIY